MTKTAPSGTPPGTYAVNANAANGSYIGSSMANVTVITAPSLTVSVSVPSTAYTTKTIVVMTSAVLYGGTPAMGASVVFTLTRGDGSTVTQAATTNSKGTAAWSYKLNGNAPIGMYSVTVRATFNTSNSGTGAAQTATSSPVAFLVR
jgi:uncharacterized protein YfaS (alpha-2-macroglobulin family)